MMGGMSASVSLSPGQRVVISEFGETPLDAMPAPDPHAIGARGGRVRRAIGA